MSLIYLLSMPRSGSTWIGKIFDSHPRVQYHHEPDGESPPPRSIPQFLDITPSLDMNKQAISYFTDILKWKSERTNTTLPLFSKSYRPPTCDRIYRIGVFGAKTFNRVGIQATIPEEPIAKKYAVNIAHVLKSVSLLSRIQFVNAAQHDCKIIHLIRHPCGYVNSRLEGERLGKLAGDTFIDTLAKTPYCINNELGKEMLLSITKEEQLAHMWIAMNEFAMLRLQNDAHNLLVCYDCICRDPMTEMKSIFDWCNLEFTTQSEKFIRKSTTTSSDRFFSVNKNPVVSSTKWTEKLRPDQISRIKAITDNSLPGRFVNDSLG